MASATHSLTTHSRTMQLALNVEIILNWNLLELYAAGAADDSDKQSEAKNSKQSKNSWWW